ncbi:MAG: DUF1844 domain-containing protein [Planctomycetaceae bacterium]
MAADDSTTGRSTTRDDAGGPLPPADFSMLVTMFATQALVAMGLIPNPATGKGEPHLELARHFIDLLGVVDEKARGNLNADEAKLIETSLHDLRMAFVEVSKRNTASESGDFGEGEPGPSGDSSDT